MAWRGQEQARGEAHPHRSPADAAQNVRAARPMPAQKRLAIYLVLAALALGCVWLVLDQFFESRGQFA